LSRVIRAGVAVLAVATLLGPSAVADAQEPPPTIDVTDQGIVPEPGSGEAPEEAGDRGGALQLATLGLVVLGISGAVIAVVRQSRRARSD
jgi:hypothetical protein